MENNLEKNIIKDIKKGKLKLRSRYLFLAEKLGLGSAFVLSFLLAILLISFILVYLKSTGNLEFLKFGSGGLFAFLEGFPFLLVGILILIILLIGFVIKKNNIAYKIPFKYLAIILLTLIILSGSVLAFGQAKEVLEDKIIDTYNKPFLEPFFKNPDNMRRKGVKGLVTEVGQDYILIENPHSTEYIKLPPDYKQEIKEGSFVMVLGNRQNDIFEAKEIIAQEGRVPRMVQKGLKNKFPDMDKDFMPGRFYPEQRNCMYDCRMQKKPPQECFQNCFEK